MAFHSLCSGYRAKAPFLSEAESFLYPPVGHAVRAPHKTDLASGVAAPFRATDPNIRFSAFKKAYDGDGYILRLYEDQGKETDASILLPDLFAKAVPANMNEHVLEELSIENSCIKLHFDPYKALTLKLTCAKM